MAVSIFPTNLIVLRDDDGISRNLIFMSEIGETWTRRDGEWVDFIVDETDPDNQLEDMQMVPVDPRFIDLWDQRGQKITPAQSAPYEYVFGPNAEYQRDSKPVSVAGEETEPDDSVTAAGAYEVNGNPLVPALRRLLADNIWAAHHAQGYHWNVKGPQFSEYHTLFQTIYDDYNLAIDPTAENLLKIGSSAPYTQADLDEARSIPDVPSAETAADMAAALLTINDALIQSTKAAYDEAAAADNQGLIDFLGARLDMLDKWSWQLRSSIA